MTKERDLPHMRVLFAASECLPFIKTGGLADVAGALPKQLNKNGTDARVVLPLYRRVWEKWGERMERLCEFPVQLGWRCQPCAVYTLTREGVTYYFLENEYYFGRDYIYGNFDSEEAERFGFFSKAILEMMPRIGFVPEVLHLNDWQCAMCAPLLKLQYAKDPAYSRTRVLMTIHNLKFQGVFDRGFTEELLSLGSAAFDHRCLEFYGAVNYLKGGIVYADRVSTVSPTYAREILTPYYGEQLDGVLRERENALTGLLNGIDADLFDPETDPALAANYSIGDMAGKALCKEALLKEFGLSVSAETPVAAVVTRLTDQKGLDLIAHVLDEMMCLDMALVVLGTGEKRYEEMFARAAERYQGRVGVRLAYDEALSHRIYAGADLFLMPSRFEPCGLSQLIALRYGAVPVVRETGGLADSVAPYNKYTDTGVGFAFLNYNAHELLYTVQHAAAYYHGDKEMWERLVRRGMEMDYSWEEASARYEDLYAHMIS